jgi:hypothetical protein
MPVQGDVQYLLDELDLQAGMLGSPETLTSLLAALRDSLNNPQGIYAGPETPVRCTSCLTEAAPRFILRHWNGMYQLLCANNDGSGCWDQGQPGMCGQFGSQGQACTNASEFRVTDVNGNLIGFRCSQHCGAVMSGAPQYLVFPLER